MAIKSGKDCAVTLGAGTVVGMGSWQIDGIEAEQFDASAFGDNWKSYEFGMKDGGTITFNGLFDPADTTGQEVLRQANLNNTDITNLQLYVDNTSYFEPCATTGYFSPTSTTGNDTFVSHVNVVSLSVEADKSGLMRCSFSCKVSGVMVLV